MTANLSLSADAVLSINSNDKAAVECWYEFSATCAVVLADDGGRLVHRHQLLVIELLQAENRLLKERLRGTRIRFTDAERALLARKAKAIGRKRCWNSTR